MKLEASRGSGAAAPFADGIHRVGQAQPVSVGLWPRQLWLLATVLLTVAALIGAVVLAPAASAPPGRGLAWLLFLGSSVHVAGTGWLYTLAEVRGHRTRYVWAPVGLVLGGMVAALAVSPVVFGWLLLPYFAWQFFHFQKQNIGMAALAASSHGVPGLCVVERRAVTLAGIAGIFGLMARPGLLQLRVDPGLVACFRSPSWPSPRRSRWESGRLSAAVLMIVRIVSVSCTWCRCASRCQCSCSSRRMRRSVG
jgi:hypothetical protein